jgi:hypothetical protein
MTRDKCRMLPSEVVLLNRLAALGIQELHATICPFIQTSPP